MNDHTTPRSRIEDFVWPTVGHPGVVPLESLVPDPAQPRKHFGDEELDQLAGTMKQGGQREIVTVRELTLEEREKYPLPARYMIVSGERRWRSAKRANLNGIEIRVKQYESLAAQKLDAYLLNEGRVGLSDIEKARAIADLVLEWGWKTQGEIALHIGESLSWVSQHLMILKLSPVAQAWMMPDIPEENRLKMQPALELARNVEDHATQEALLARMPKGRTTALQQVAWVQRELKTLGIEVVRRTHRPSIVRQITAHFTEQVDRRVALLLESSNIDLIFVNANSTQTQELVKKVSESLGHLQNFLKKVQDLAHVHLLDLAERNRVEQQGREIKLAPVPPKPTPPTPKPAVERIKVVVEARKLPPPKIPAQVVAVKPPPPVEELPIPLESLRPKRIIAAPFAGSVFKDQVPKPIVRKRADINVSYFDEGVGRIVLGTLSPQQYVQYWDRGLLKFQQEKTEKPDFLPTREEVAEKL